MAALSQLLAPRLAARIGLIPTMVFTHLPANVFLVLAGLSPYAWLAVLLLVLRASLSQMDVPARQAFVMAVVRPEERAAAASVTNVPRSLAAAATPAFAGWLLANGHLAAPLVLAGVAKGDLRPAPPLAVPSVPGRRGRAGLAALRPHGLRPWPQSRIPTGTGARAEPRARCRNAGAQMGGAGTPGGTVTLLFTDVTGSTELAERLGDLQYDELLRGHKAALHAAVAANGGRVVKDLGDGLMVVFGSARAAALAAASMQAAVVRGELGLRVGVHTGEAMETGGDLHGRAVNTAARICAAAGDGEVLLSALTHALVDTAGDLSFDPPRGEWLKGIEGETQVHPLRWADHARAGAVVGDDQVAGGEALELAPIPPPPLLDGGAFTFVGRDDVLDDLLTAWKRATTGSRGLVLLAGEPGVGKTRLAAEIARRVLDSDGHVLAGRCDEELGVAYLPFVEALRHCCDHVPAASLASVLGRLPGELRRLWPELGELVPSLAEALDADTETQRYRLFDAVASWLSALSSTRPVLLVLDDLHWATPPTIQLLRHLLRAPTRCTC